MAVSNPWRYPPGVPRCDPPRAEGRFHSIVSLDDAAAASNHLPDVELLLMPDESHLGGFAAADDVLSFIHSQL
ncbi:hypothetical protein [Mycolicibacterium confluentis]|uniref:Uncharacterized protein n=1 Tax=Mycolicibacterium confluentis TaxID=28047 RepID=A0A7I7Y0X2_9MYCO|nr:hypothetical protein [Mycolicibacterium confluentis]ORV34768.1 hypothetical protein AWB99_04050 [Mycolicibacterium confluentis]BBZ35285.1 hypothetical protein MCNF_38900 [Mycolicibacterium confluentis]